MLYLNIKRYIKSPLFVCVTIVYIVMLVVMQPAAKDYALLSTATNGTLLTQPFSFLFFMLVSYEFFYQIKKHHLQETIETSKMGPLREKGYGILLFLLLDLFITACFLAVSMWSTTKCLGFFSKEYFCLLIKLFAVQHFLTYAFAVLLGVLASLITSRVIACSMMIAVFSCFSRVLFPVLITSADSNEAVAHIVDILGIMGRNYTVLTDMFYEYTTEAVNTQRILFWLFLCLFILLLRLTKGRCRLTAYGSLLCAGICLCLYIQPSGERYCGSSSWNIYGEQDQYYQLFFSGKKKYGYETPEEHEGIGRKYKEADFKALSYTGDLTIQRILSADIEVKVDQEQLPEYRFTLYHAYQLKKVLDADGNELAFEQDGDHVLVKVGESRQTQRIRFIYKGYSRRSVTTSQAIYLEGNFPYLPMPGWREYAKETKENTRFVAYDQKGLNYPTDFSLSVHTKQKVYSNLSEEQPHTFVGRSEGATLIASPFMRTVKVQKATLCYSYLSGLFRQENYKETIANYEKVLQKYPELNRTDMTFFECGNADGNDSSQYFASDHIFAFVEYIDKEYLRYKQMGYTPSTYGQEEDDEQE